MAKRNKQQTRQQKRQQKSEQLENQVQKSEPQKSEPQKSKNKTWKRAGLFDTYVKAAEFKTRLLEQSDSLEVKILRCGNGGDQFQVKLWSPTGTKKPRKSKKQKNSANSAPVAQ